MIPCVNQEDDDSSFLPSTFLVIKAINRVCFFQTILFTMDEEILEAMAQYDQTYDGDVETEDDLLRSCYFERPSTADLDEHGVSKF